jgi:hypothetical protein
MPAHGAVAEWLGSGLQSRLHQFDSGRRLSPEVRCASFAGSPLRFAQHDDFRRGSVSTRAVSAVFRKGMDPFKATIRAGSRHI